MRSAQRSTSKESYLLVAALAATGTILGAFAYFGEATGVEGTLGALLALVGAVAVAMGALMRLANLSRGLALALDVLLGMGTLLTAIAAFMLMQYFFAGAMLLGFLALLAAFYMSRRDYSNP